MKISTFKGLCKLFTGTTIEAKFSKFSKNAVMQQSVYPENYMKEMYYSLDDMIFPITLEATFQKLFLSRFLHH